MEGLHPAFPSPLPSACHREMWKNDPFDDINQQPERKHSPLVLMFLVLLALLYCSQVVINLYAITDEKTLANLAESFPPWAAGLQALCGALNLMWIAAIFFWQRIGFYGFIATSLGMTAINLLCEMDPKLAT